MHFLPFTFFNDIIYWLIFIVCKMSERKFMVTFHVFKRSDCTCLMRKHRKVVKLHLIFCHMYSVTVVCYHI